MVWNMIVGAAGDMLKSPQKRGQHTEIISFPENTHLHHGEQPLLYNVIAIMTAVI